MMRYLGAVALVLLIGDVADADSTEDRVRALIDSYRSGDSRGKWEVVFDPATANAPGPLVCEYSWDDGDQLRYGQLRFEPRAGAVAVLALTLVTLPKDGPSWTPEGCKVRQATMSPEVYAEFIKSAQLVVRARLARRTDPGAAPALQRQGRWHVGNIRIRVGALWDGKGDLTPAVWVEEGLVEASIQEHSRAFLLERVLARSVASLTLERVQVPVAGLVSSLRKGLASTTGWRRDLRAAFLGWLGGVEDLEALRATKSLTPVTARACRQIELLTSAESSEKGLERLLNLTADPDAGLSAWARVVGRANFTDAYKKKLARDYHQAEDWNVRNAVLEEYGRADPSDDFLRAEALKDPEPAIRAMAARQMGRWRILLKIAKDKSARRKGDGDGRLLAIHALGRFSGAKQDDIGAALARILLDDGDDVDARKEAAEAIGFLGYREAIPQLVAMLDELRPSEGRDSDSSGSRGYAMRVGVVRTLGLLRARESSDALLQVLRNGVEGENLDERGLAAVAGESLARIGDRRAESWLRQACERADANNAENKAEWHRRLRLIRAISAGDGAGILEVFDDGRVLVRASGWFGSCDRFWIDLLVDVVAVGDLRKLATARAHRKNREAAVIRAALERKAKR